MAMPSLVPEETGTAGTAGASRAEPGWTARRAWLAHYFDRTASAAWARLTSDAPVSRIRRTVREGRDRMHATLLGFLPARLDGMRVLDAGCGTGRMARDLAARGAQVTAIDLSPTLVDLARERWAGEALDGRIDFRSGDMLDPALGTFDWVLAMDSLIHYETPDVVDALARLAARTRHGILFTFAPRTPLLAAMHAAGRWFPRADRAPAIAPADETRLRAALAASLPGWCPGRGTRVSRGFYTSHALELCRNTATGQAADTIPAGRS